MSAVAEDPSPGRRQHDGRREQMDRHAEVWPDLFPATPAHALRLATMIVKILSVLRDIPGGPYRSGSDRRR
jgi:hypothetical protein